MEFRRLYRICKYYARKGQSGSGAISAVIGALVMGIAGVFMFTVISGMTKSVANDLPATTVTTTNTLGQTTTSAVAGGSSALTGLLGILPFVFVAAIIFGVVAHMGGIFSRGSDEEEEKKPEKATRVTYDGQTVKTNSAHTISVVEKASAILLQYQNDLEGILGIKTAVDNHKYFGLDLTGNTLAINEEDYDWYITAKQKDENVFKVVGLNKTDASNNVVYVLGSRKGLYSEPDEAGWIDSDKPFLIKVPVTRVANEVNAPAHMASEGRN